MSRGCVAKIEIRHRELSPRSCLGGYPEDACNESDLSSDVSLAYPIDLPFPDHVHRLIPRDRPPRRVEGNISEPRTNSPLDEPMVLLDDVVEILNLPQLTFR